MGGGESGMLWTSIIGARRLRCARCTKDSLYPKGDVTSGLESAADLLL